ncbi:hypothetical protein Q7M_1395 (plasmid) [Borrelia crocidurae str. Achema]|uniref:Variable outer membrane protein n=1 Tax=Borrelia crocidurae (strain Achema) TaxID=1155096 RepID=I0FDV1_BORCA|nr:hypothetical protein Q7M_1395 [Borrelia crocidurae str. Achema]
MKEEGIKGIKGIRGIKGKEELGRKEGRMKNRIVMVMMVVGYVIVEE